MSNSDVSIVWQVGYVPLAPLKGLPLRGTTFIGEIKESAIPIFGSAIICLIKDQWN